jgi:small subunit ribosomal protein S12
MSTYNQLVRNPRRSKKKNKQGLGSPQREGVCDNVGKMTPNKPNSALRSYAIINFKDGTKSFAYVPGEGHNIQKYSVLLVEGGGAQDLTGVRRSVIRGAQDRDAEGVKNRKQGRSKYGTKK